MQLESKRVRYFDFKEVESLITNKGNGPNELLESHMSYVRFEGWQKFTPNDHRDCYAAAMALTPRYLSTHLHQNTIGF